MLNKNHLINPKMPINHPLLSRLIKEVENEQKTAMMFKYDRTHNRHNRGQ
ncbi:YhhA family cyclophane-containing RiPP [Neisseria bergeri]|nr:YhhA family cyclophane-containing RiPP [Neisseria bergeri]